MMFHVKCFDCGAWVADEDWYGVCDVFAKAHYRVTVDPDWRGNKGHSSDPIECSFTGTNPLP
jgi:hypothetical protein